MPKRILFTLILSTFSSLLLAQTEESLNSDTLVTDSLSEGATFHEKKRDFKVFTVAEKMPQFKGGARARAQFLKANIEYPEIGKDEKIEGGVYVTFIVMKDGSILEPKILKGISPEIDEEVLRVIKAMPKWVPGRQHNTPVAVQFILPVRVKVYGANVKVP